MSPEQEKEMGKDLAELEKEKDLALAEKMAESTIEYIELSSILIAYGYKDGSVPPGMRKYHQGRLKEMFNKLLSKENR